MRCLRILFAVGVVALAAASARAAHTQARLVLSAASARPGDTLTAGLHLTMDETWHTYWRNSGDSGMPTKIKWSLPPGVTAGEIHWPLPEKNTAAGLTTYVYEHEVVLLVPLTLASNLPAGPLELRAQATWLECAEACLPGETNLTARLVIAATNQPSADAELITRFQLAVPVGQPQDETAWDAPSTNDLRTFTYDWMDNMKPTTVDFFPYAAEDFEIKNIEQLPTVDGSVRARFTVKKLGDRWPTEMAGLLHMKFGGTNEEPSGFAETLEMNLKINDPDAPVTTPILETKSAAAAPAASASLALMLLFAFLGGLLLNLMPCVLPVIALKILGFVSQAGEDPQRVRRLGIFYTLGVLASFFVLADLVVAVQLAGHRASWGMQFSQPTVIVALAALVFLVALNLFGVFEFSLGARVSDAAGRAASGHGASGAFWNGVLATVLATPCTAPFLAPALGYAFVQPPLIVVLFFLTIGLGLALPYLALSWQPAWLKFLPKPGAWMSKLKFAMGIPMLATTVWLGYVAAAFYGGKIIWLAVFLLFLGVAAWILGKQIQRGSAKKSAWLACTLVLLVGYAFALEHQMHWRTVLKDMPPEPLQTSPDGIAWQPWSARAVAEARGAGRVVLVDFTARWCTTCQVNKAVALETAAVRARLKELNAVALLADYTHFPDDIGAELARHQRAGVPLVLVYPADAAQPPQILPATLTPQIVLDALNKAARAESK
ncbi:MAG: hypothetical protein RL380_1533 [Verrucomicrobiota bacterium]|jgi:thiol:disulfide interchange protein DsbD